MAKPAPSHIRDVEQAVHTIEIDECPEIGQVLNAATNNVAHLHTFEEFLTLLASFLFDQFTSAQDDIFSVVVNLNDLEVVSVADELL